MREPEGPVSYGQASIIGKSIGGLASYAPELMGREGEKGGSHQAALSAKGLTKARASAVLDVMIKEGVAKMHGGMQMTPAQVGRARQILAEVGGVNVGSRAAANPWAFRNMAGRPRQFGLPAAPPGDPRYAKLPGPQLQAMGAQGDHAAFIELSRRSASKGMRKGVKAPPDRAAKRSKFKKDDVVMAGGGSLEMGVVLKVEPRDSDGTQWYTVQWSDASGKVSTSHEVEHDLTLVSAAANPRNRRSR
jgi:hypothetical protein